METTFSWIAISAIIFLITNLPKTKTLSEYEDFEVVPFSDRKTTHTENLPTRTRDLFKAKSSCLA